MKVQVLSLAMAVAAVAAPANADASSFFEFRISALGTGFIFPYCTQAQGPTCAVQRPIIEEIRSPLFGEYIEEGVNIFSSGRYNAAGQFSFTIERRGTSLYGRDVRFLYQPCSAGSCDLKMLSSSSFTIATNSGVPEPATWLTMILGFSAVGYSMRRRVVVRQI
ncbi:PEPxxWA-CTERM sorting domain-containing protein [Sphingomonas sp. RRHST34]|uniref:PEPxxWA-CTERM sorting domain-containing protein n=1 Tax=Sphingomonas citri TaxID=2862499 RepID=A0ABS7BMC5_9SPHN|nr:PEPxxWA-CTERM sorting domain-containing protein [Sphingomonas citri]MBW6530741.1 PEPxxWA-CTERM sorting domain-containing protein [Sphingomonas citri]